MPFVSVTRLHLASRWHLPAFVFHSLRSVAQARRAPGYLGGWTSNDAEMGFWTATVWTGLDAMRAFRNSGAHLRAMPKLLGWCDVASFTHFEQEDASVPTADAAYERLTRDGHLSKVHAPSARQRAAARAGQSKPRSAQQWKPR